MQLLDKLKKLPKGIKLLLALLLLLVLVSVYFLPERREMLPQALQSADGAIELATTQDEEVYLAAREFIEALVQDERDLLLAMLTESHAANWTAASFLYDGTALREGQRAALGQFRHNVVRYVQPPELGGERVALLTVHYTVLFKDGETVEKEVRIEENMGLQLVDGTWLVAADQRKILE